MLNYCKIYWKYENTKNTRRSEVLNNLNLWKILWDVLQNVLENTNKHFNKIGIYTIIYCKQPANINNEIKY